MNIRMLAVVFDDQGDESPDGSMCWPMCLQRMPSSMTAWGDLKGN